MFFLRREAHAIPLFKDFNILKLHDKITLENCVFINKYFKHQLSQPFDNWFVLSSNFHTHNTRWSNLGCLNVHRTKLYGKNSVCISTIFAWNYLQNFHRNILFHKLITKCLKKLLTLHSLPPRLHAICSIKNGLKFYFRILLCCFKRVWWRGYRPS